MPPFIPMLPPLPSSGFGLRKNSASTGKPVELKIHGVYSKSAIEYPISSRLRSRQDLAEQVQAETKNDLNRSHIASRPEQHLPPRTIPESAPSDRHDPKHTLQLELCLQEYEQKLPNTAKALEEAVDNAETLRIDFEHAKEQIDRCNAVNHTQKVQIQSPRRRIISQQTEYEAKSGQKSVQIKQLQDKLIQGLVDGRWTPIPVEKMRGHVASLNSEIRNWAKEWAAQDLTSKVTNAEMTTYLSTLSQYLGSASFKYTLQLSPKLRAKLPAILLNAAVADIVQKFFVGDPFFCTGYENRMPLTNVFEAACEVDQREGHRCRSTLLRFFNPPRVHNMSQYAVRISETTQESVKDWCAFVQGYLMNCTAKNLIRIPKLQSEYDDQQDGLQKIFAAAADIATGLLTQRSIIQIFDLAEMQARHMRFDVSSPILRAHPLHKVDTEDESHNGREILVVVSPALLAFELDNMKGFEGGEYRILAKAVVLLGEQEAAKQSSDMATHPTGTEASQSALHGEHCPHS